MQNSGDANLPTSLQDRNEAQMLGWFQPLSFQALQSVRTSWRQMLTFAMQRVPRCMAHMNILSSSSVLPISR